MTAAAPARVPVPTPLRGGSPEAWLWGIAGAGWLTLVLLTLATSHDPGTAAHHMTAGGHHATGSFAAHAAGSLAMVAVMAPLIGPNVRYAAARSPSRGRRAVAIDVVAGWAVVWLGAAAVLGIGTEALGSGTPDPAAIAAVTVVAAAWQATAVKRRSLARCDRRLAPPLDRRAARQASRRFGAGLGRDCALSCWPLMTLMATAGHSAPVVAACAGVAWFERRRRPHHDPPIRETALAIAAIGAAVVLVSAVF